jgi:hypothetical protein
MAGPPNSGDDRDPPSVRRSRNQVLGRLHANLKRVPGTENVRFERSGTGIDREIAGDVDPIIFADGVIPREEAHVKVNWWPQPDDEATLFEIHYWEPEGCDGGWHRQPNDHVDGIDHVQWRDSADDEYEYEPLTIEAGAPVGILWEVVGELLPERLKNYYD